MKRVPMGPAQLLLSIVLLLILYGNMLRADPGKRVQRLWDHPQVQLAVLLMKGQAYHRLHDARRSDSLFSLAQKLAAEAVSDSMLYTVYRTYLNQYPLLNKDMAREYAEARLQLSNRIGDRRWLSEAYRAQAYVLLSLDDLPAATDAVRQADHFSSVDGSPSEQGEVKLLQGIAAQKSGAKLHAFQLYLDAIYLAESAADDKVLLKCYSYLSEFYDDIGDFAKATETKLREIEKFRKLYPSDTVGYMDLQIALAAGYLYDGKPAIARSIMERVIAFSRRHGNRDMTLDALDVWRSSLISNGKIAEVKDIYHRRYPEEMVYLAAYDRGLYYRLNALFSEYSCHLDSAAEYYKLAEQELLANSRDSIFEANFYRRYGQFLLRAGHYAAAEQKLLKAQDLNSSVQYMPYALDVSMLLDSVYQLQGQFQKAYRYAHLSEYYQTLKAEAAKKDKVLLLELDHERRRHSMQQERAAAELKRQHNLQYYSIILLITTSFIILALMGSFKPPKILIRATGFISFILLFEFIILLIDHWIHDITHGTPWKVLGLKIIIISFLLPFHHWLEEKVLHYLYTHRLIHTERFSLWRASRRPVTQAAAPQESVIPPPERL